MNKIALLTSGGDAPGMNPAIRAATRNAIYNGVEVIGVKRGFAGLIEGDFIELTERSVADIVQKGGTMLLSARCEEFKTEEGMATALENMQKEGIEGLVTIGGDGTMRGTEEINRDLDFPAVGVPATIDNDMACTDYSIGFDTAMNTILDAVDRIRDTATSHERTFIIETMGRRAGFLTLGAGLAGGAESILIPEIDFSIDEVAQKIKKGYEKGKLHSIVLVAEGVGEKFQTNRDINKSRAFLLGEIISEKIELETRVIILGHLQRGGKPTAQDRILGSRMGARAVELLLDGQRNKMVSYEDCQLSCCEITEMLSQEKKVNREMYDLANILSI
ncbi:MAG: 6-phosphofructokinase [Halanaerobiaceae bacterium]